MPNLDFRVQRSKPRGKHLMPSKQRRPHPRVREHSRKASHGRHATLLSPDRSGHANDQSVDDTPDPNRLTVNDVTTAVDPKARHSSGVNGNDTSANRTAGHPLTAAPDVVVPTANGRYKATEETIHHMWQISESASPHPRLQPSPFHSLRQVTAHRTRSGLWATLGLVALAAAITVALVMSIGGPGQDNPDVRAAVGDAAAVAAGSVEDSLATLESLRAGDSFTPDLVSSISALGDASRNLVESAAALPTDDSSLAEIRMLATALAGRASRLGETFGAAFSYRGQLGPNLTFPDLNAPLEISNLSENTTLLTDWQFRLEQAASAQPGQPRLLQNQQALEATLPYIAVHRQAYSDAVGNGQLEQAQAALSQMASLVSAIEQDFDRAYLEIAEIAEAEIASLTADLQNLMTGM